MTIVVDYGMGNVGSILNMFRRIGCDAAASSDAQRIASADRLVLPGVGAFDHAMRRLRSLGLVDPLCQKALVERVPVLGICLGLQLFTRRSEEGDAPGLGWIAAETKRFAFPLGLPRLQVPHMGWNFVRPRQGDTLFAGTTVPYPRFYFVHSYHVVCECCDDISAWCTYGYDFACAVHRGNIMGVQFHPEKSHRFGLELLRNFARPPQQ